MRYLVTIAALAFSSASTIAQTSQWIYAEQAKLLPPMFLSQDDYFGRDVAVSGNRAVVGAYLDDPNGADSGAAFVFVRSATGWAFETRLLPQNPGSPNNPPEASDQFGFAVDIDGDTAVVGAYADNQPAGNAGAAFIYERIGGVWTQQAVLTASDAAADDWFGVDVAIDGDLIVCGASQANPNGTDSGAAYVFARSGGAWCQQFKLVPADGAPDDYFGRAVDVSGDTIVVGAYSDNEPVSEEGSAYVFVRVDDAVPGVSCGDTWAQEGAKLLNPNRAPTDYFGFSVAIDGDNLVVGADYDDHDTAGTSRCGSFTVFDRVPGPLWVVNTKVFASNNGAADYHVDDVFGHDVAIQGDTVVAGAHGDVIFGVDNVGSAYVYKRTLANGWAQRLKVLASDGMYNDQFGVSVDVDGDTLVSGAFLDDAAGGDSGSAYAYVLRKDTYATYCLGDGSGAACPCTNNSTAGAAQGCKNSLGRGALLRPSGSTSIAANDLELYACNVPTGNACVLFGGMSTNGGLPFFAGLKCVPPPTVRLGLKSSSSTGYVAWGPGLNGGYWSAGQTWYYQVWYRDPTFTGCSPAKTTNLTNGVQVTF